MLKTTKEICSGLEKLVNKRVTYYNALKLFVFIRMGMTESEDFYVKRVHSNIENLILARGKGALCCSKTLVASDKDNPTKKEVKYEVDKLAEIHIIESGDAKRFSDLAKDLMHQAHLGQDLYPASSAGAFELMVRRSGRYQELGQRQGHRSGRGGHNGGRGNVYRGNNPIIVE